MWKSWVVLRHHDTVEVHQVAVLWSLFPVDDWMYFVADVTAGAFLIHGMIF